MYRHHLVFTTPLSSMNYIQTYIIECLYPNAWFLIFYIVFLLSEPNYFYKYVPTYHDYVLDNAPSYIFIISFFRHVV